VCGIAGFFGPPDPDLLAEMTSRIEHRGPDDSGFLERARTSLGHRRLSIIDLDLGRQPMSNPENTLHLAYNGELYNFRELRAELEQEGITFSTASDTEVVLRAYETWGSACFPRFNGMWALAIVDERPADGPELVLSRDHLGIKPLYLAQAGVRLLFASEIKALLACADLVPEPDEKRLAEYLLRGLHDHDERTFFQGVRQVPPASVVVVSGPPEGRSERTETYWTPELSTSASADPVQFRAAFIRAVERRLVADVTVGTCLSGGLDSSSIVAVMTELLSEGVPDAASMGGRLKTFSAVFDGDPIDEQRYITAMLEQTGAEGHYVHPLSEELFEDLPLVVWHQDEPMVSSGPYAQYRVMALAKGKAKVLLDGQGGDELLAGYVPYQYVYLRELLHAGQFKRAGHEASTARDVLAPLVRQRLSDRRKAIDPATLCSDQLVGSGRGASAVAADQRTKDNLKARLLQDLTTYSLPSLLRYEDRNSMAHSIESRPPFLDQELVELVLALPADAIVRDGWSRWILRESLRGVLPEVIRTRRKKIGFTTPEIRWLRAQRAVVQGILRSPVFCSRPYWDGPPIARAFRAVCDGEIEESPFFWRVLNAEAWLRVFHGPVPLAPGGARPERSLQRAGDEATVAMLGDARTQAEIMLDAATVNPGRHLFAAGPEGRAVWARVPIHTPLIKSGDVLESVVLSSIEAACDGRIGIEPGDVVAISEKAVAVSQGRSFPVSTLRPHLLAKVLSRFVKRTPAGIGLGIPETMQLAIDEAGATRILAASAIGGAARLFGVHGTFYRIAGPGVRAIDGPTAGTLPPYDTHAKLPPTDPDGVALRIARRLSEVSGGPVEVAIVDANDLGVNILGTSGGSAAASAHVAELAEWLFGDNPLGQGSEQTPIALLRRVGELD
jgi:asparagine synthase (glutamine-hydrolysing)